MSETLPHTHVVPSQWKAPGLGDVQTKSFDTKRWEEELFGATQLRSSRKNGSSLCQYQRFDSKWKKNRLEYRPYLYSANIYLFKVSKGNTRKRCEICLKLTTKTLQQRRSVVFLVNFKHISHLFLVLLLLTLSKQMFAWKYLFVICRFWIPPTYVLYQLYWYINIYQFIHHWAAS